MKVSIIIPAYNEEKRIKRTLDEYLKFFRQIKKETGLNFDFIIVLNGCRDNTLGIIQDYANKNKEISYLNFKENGKGFAIVQGFKEALKKDYELIGFVDADMSTSPSSFYDLIKNIGNYDGAIASRCKKGAHVNMSLMRKITHKGFNFFARGLLFLPFHDTQCGAKLFRRKAVQKVVQEGLGVTMWAFDVELLYKLHRANYRILEVPTVWEEEKGSRLNILRTPLQMFSAVARMRLMYSPFKFVVDLYNRLPENMQIHNLLRK